MNQRKQLRIFYKNKKYIPLDLRPKKTKAMRLALTCHERSLKTLKERKKLKYFPKRIYALEVIFLRNYINTDIVVIGTA